MHIALPEGEHSPIVVGARSETVTLLLNHKGKVDGRDYHDAEGRLIVTPSHSGSKSVSLRIVPEVHHGETRRTIAPLENDRPVRPAASSRSRTASRRTSSASWPSRSTSSRARPW